MNAALQSKEFVSGLVDVLSQGIQHDRFEDAEAVLACIRVLRPKLAELDTFEAWIAMKRGFYADAIRILRNLDATASNFALGKAVMTLCQFACGDGGWRATATDVLENGNSPEATALVNLLIDPEGAVSGHAEQAAPAPAAARSSAVPEPSYLRG